MFFLKTKKEIMDFYGLKGSFGKLRIRAKILKTWILHKSAYSSINSSWVIRMQRSRGVKIGKNCHLSPYVLIDLIYPGMISIGNNVTIGSNTMIFAHYNPTANALLKENGYPREVKKVTIKRRRSNWSWKYYYRRNNDRKKTQSLVLAVLSVIRFQILQLPWEIPRV